MITNAQEILLKQYKEKAFINALLNEESCNYYNYLKNLINIPLIICNSVMVCINSMIENQDTLKILNIILNASTGLILIRNDKQLQNLRKDKFELSIIY